MYGCINSLLLKKTAWPDRIGSMYDPRSNSSDGLHSTMSPHPFHFLESAAMTSSGAWTSSTSTPTADLGWMKATSYPAAPERSRRKEMEKMSWETGDEGETMWSGGQESEEVVGDEVEDTIVLKSSKIRS
jgi:hypothetical protein